MPDLIVIVTALNSSLTQIADGLSPMGQPPIKPHPSIDGETAMCIIASLNASFATIASQGNKVLSNLNDTFTAPKNGFMFVRAGNNREGSMNYVIKNNNLRCCEFSQSTYSTQWFPVKKR